MITENKIIKIREIIIALIIGLTMLVLGICFDFQISSKVYDPIDTNAFGIIMSGIAELPVCFALCFGGISLIVARIKDKKWKEILCWIFGIIAIGVGLYFVYDTWMDITKFDKTVIFNINTPRFNPLILILGIIFTLIFGTTIIVYVILKRKKYDLNKLFSIGLHFLIISALVALFATLGKYLWSRPRPNYIFTQEDPSSLFHGVWNLDPFKVLSQSHSDSFKSFPSGHSTYACLAMFVLPYLTLLSDKTKNDRKLQIILFYIGLGWGLICCFSRILAGCHFLSDTAGGLLISLIVCSVAASFMFKQPTADKDDIQKKKKRTISNVVFLLLLSVFVVILLFSIGDIQAIIDQFNAIKNGNNYIWLLIAIALVLVYFILWPLSQCIYAKALKTNATFFDSYLIGNSEHFYNGITPFSTGGQPFQIYSYTKRKVTTANATGIVLASFVTFMLVTNLFAIVSLFFWPSLYSGFEALNKTYLIWIALIGFVINFSVLIFMFALGTSRKLREFLTNILKKIAGAQLFHNEKHKLMLKFGTFLEKQVPVFETYCTNAQVAFKQVWTHKLASVFAVLIKIVDMFCYYAIPFFLLKATGIELAYDQLMLITFATSFAITAVVWMPTPGGVGGIELAFMMVIAAALHQSGDVSGVVLLWRLLTFYLLIILSFATNSVFEAISSHKMKKEEQENV